MPDISPLGLISARKAYRRVYGPNEDAREAVCGLCGKSIDVENEDFVIAVNGVWTHWDCINDSTKEVSNGSEATG